MRTKEQLLKELKDAVALGIVSRQDINSVLGTSVETAGEGSKIKKMSVVQSLFYVAGIILFAAVLSVIAQTWGDGVFLHVMLTTVLGATIWLIAYLIYANKQTSDLQQGLGDALLLTGSLLVITGGYIIVNSFGGTYGGIDFFEAAPMLLVLAGVHGAFYYIVRRDLLYLMSIFLGVASVGSMIFGVLRDADASGNIWALAFIALAGLLAWSTRVISRMTPVTEHMYSAYDKLAIVLSLLVMYIASFGEKEAAIWYMALAAGICGVYYLSIVMKQKILLGTASVFLVLVTITVAFRYFVEFGVTTSLIVSAMGILAVAALASQLSKKYLS